MMPKAKLASVGITRQPIGTFLIEKSVEGWTTLPLIEAQNCPASI
jgi:hypothetical protein